MSTAPRQLQLPGFDHQLEQWRASFAAQCPQPETVRNRSGIEIAPLYTPADHDPADYLEQLGFPGAVPMTRGIYPSMHRGRSWSQRQLVGLGAPDDYNRRLHEVLAAGGTAVSLIPCNSVYRGLDADQVDPALLGSCGVVVNTVDDMDRCLAGIDIGRVSIGLNDPSPFTLLALLLAVARRRGVDAARITGTSNQSDYLSHFVANHMFFRLALPGARRVLLDHIKFAACSMPGWNPLSVVGQHMQQAGATPAEAMAFTLSSAIQYADDCVARGLSPDSFLPRFTFFFDISVSLFEEVAKFRAGRRLWARITRERFGAVDPRSWRFKFHGQTSGADLTREEPLNNTVRVTAQAVAGILGGLQSLHTDAYDEALSTPTVEAARVAIQTQNILREEVRLGDVIDPLGGSYYVEALTDRMEHEIGALITRIDEAGGMYQAVEQGLVQSMIGDSALAFQDRLERGEQVIVGVNAYRDQGASAKVAPLPRPDPRAVEAQLASLASYRAKRDNTATRRALDALARAAESDRDNTFSAAVEAAFAGATHGEIVERLRQVLGFGEPLVVA